MTKKKKRLPLATIPERCGENWQDMPGSKTQRHCDVCDGTVYNLSEMTEDEAEALLEADEDRCVVLYRRKRDGAILTADRPRSTGLSQPSRIAVTSVAVAFGAAVAATTVVSVAEAPPAQQEEEIEVAMGGFKLLPRKPKVKRSERARRHERRKARARRRVSGDSSETKPKATKRKKRVRKLSPRELLRRSIRTERSPEQESAQRADGPKKSSKP